MSKKCYRFFGGLLSAQENWLNKMAAMGYRLIRTEKLLYEFQKCSPGEVEYRIDFIAEKSAEKAKEYHDLLEELGYRVFFKNINLNYSVGKVHWRPWAEKGGRIASNATTFNRELLIVEKSRDGKPFELHTTYEDKAGYCANLRDPWFMLFVLFGVLGLVQRSALLLTLGAIALIPVFLYQIQILKFKQDAKTKEW
ncbi:DUF2812 domain-containing protein [Anaerofilum sp. BX8]|uniref:DUF2812 domain-containing protein n=1 Tax=Anaerofilum hominis TaxID=2763016 RepID=A0A923I8N3_9FIRM|nr:DUF2812 domain-containing protein [Anaerofilum hominis]MBC5581884.1 DUF2812 domain-containing protein [Anaerofilum hominis]